MIRAWIFTSSMIAKMTKNADVKASVTVLPHAGLVLGFLAALAALILLTVALNQRNRRDWVFGVHALGAAVGSILLVFYVQPWSIILTWEEGGQRVSPFNLKGFGF